MLSSKTYDRHLSKHLFNCQAYLDSQFADIKTAVMVWIDNYQVFQPRTSPRVDEILWRNSKMCAVAALIVPVTSEETKFLQWIFHVNIK